MAKIDEIIYIGDPMCSWCWGAAPELSKLKTENEAEIPFKIILGGLRPGTTAPMKAELKVFLRAHWQEIQEMTGQAFDFKILERNDFIYDTEPAARAVLSVRMLKPSMEFEFFKGIQQAFYAQGKDTNQLETYLELCPTYQIPQEDFEQTFLHKSTIAATLSEFDQARSLGVMGFPTVLIRMEAKHKALARGYNTFENMQNELTQWKNA